MRAPPRTRRLLPDGGVLGRIPANRLYQTGLNILNSIRCPTHSDAGVGYNYQMTRPIESMLTRSRRSGSTISRRRSCGRQSSTRAGSSGSEVFTGSLPGFNDTQMQNPIVCTLAFTANYTLNPTTFLEGTYGRSRNELAGCALAQSGTGRLLQNAIPMNTTSNRANTGLGGLPMLFPNANKLNPDYYATRPSNGMNPTPPAWVGGDFLKSPWFSYGNRVATRRPTPRSRRIQRQRDPGPPISLTKVRGRHTIKSGYYNTHSYKAEQATRDRVFGTITSSRTPWAPTLRHVVRFANAAMGCFSSFQQASKYVEGNYVYDNREAYIQDNWKVNSRLTLDYGMRFVHRRRSTTSSARRPIPAGQMVARARAGAVQTLVARSSWHRASPAPASRQALNPLTGQLSVPTRRRPSRHWCPARAIRRTASSGRAGHRRHDLHLPGLGVAPRFGMAYDVTGRQKFVLRGGGGLFFDRPFGNAVISMAGNPRRPRTVNVRYTNLQGLGPAASQRRAPHHSTRSSTTQAAIFVPVERRRADDAAVGQSLDVEYVGQHSWNRSARSTSTPWISAPRTCRRIRTRRW